MIFPPLANIFDTFSCHPFLVLTTWLWQRLVAKERKINVLIMGTLYGSRLTYRMYCSPCGLNKLQTKQFLGATKHLYNWLCPLVGWLVGLSGNAFVRRSTRRTLLAYLALFNKMNRKESSDLSFQQLLNLLQFCRELLLVENEPRTVLPSLDPV